jgi:uncharacterized metal-binding protein
MRKAGERRCMREDGAAPPNCPTEGQKDLVRESLGVYRSEEYGRMAGTAALVERAGYGQGEDGTGLRPLRPRIVELVDFARRMGYKKLSLLFCMGLRKEAAIVDEILKTNGFEVISAVCKVGGLPKAELGLKAEDQLNPRGAESMCNPVMQAEIANRAGAEFNVLLGLCIGHDTLAIAHLKAPVTVLAVKDRLMANNPLGAVYMYDSYCQYLKKPLFPERA